MEPAEIEMFIDKQSGTNTDRDGYRELMVAIEDGEIDQVVASEVSRISRSVRDFSATVGASSTRTTSDCISSIWGSHSILQRFCCN
ncbi:recombinase family protein [Halocatena halophila]|uniref:recombinase family protein n=1 Tax=Halocatena halophila TaxID=2814576 RepID=UPI002ED41B1C